MTNSSTSRSSVPLLSNTTYNYLKYTVQIALPAMGTLYFTLAGIWNLPYGEQVVGTITAIALFGGVMIGISKRSYDRSDTKFDGYVNVDNSVDDPYSLEFKKTLPALTENQNEVTLKVNKLSQ